MSLETIAWTGQAVRLLDQTALPAEIRYVEVGNERQMHDAIRRLVVRGAPAIGLAGAFGVYLGVRQYRSLDLLGFYARLNEVADYLATSRPTAMNLFWALERMRRVAREAGRSTCSLRPGEAIEAVKGRLLGECLAMLEEDVCCCRTIGEHGLSVLAACPRRPVEILTHCNAGGLATARYGTALAPVYVGEERGVRFHVWVDETRPLLQGSRLTAFELKAAGVEVTVICDSMAADVMARGWVDAVLVGADRIAANGDVANKVGTLGLAILARHFGIPLYVAAPTSTIDRAAAGGSDIPIEQRAAEEISCGFGRCTVPEGVAVYNPAFDVTPAGLVTGIITEKGIFRPPYAESLK